MTERTSIEVVEGASWGFDVEFSDESGAPYDLTGFSARMQLRAALTGDVVIDITSGECLIDALNGVVSVDIAPVKTTDITRRGLRCALIAELDVETSGASVRHSVPLKFIITPEATR